MKLTDREEAVIKVMLHAKHGVTASELSSALNVSSKTVYRTVSAINEKYCHHDLIKAKIGTSIVNALLLFFFMLYFRY